MPIGKRSSTDRRVRLRAHKLKPMAKKLYVGGVSYSTTQDGLKAAFEKAGQVTSADIMMDRMTGKSRGFGFVEMATDEEAQKAIDMWNGQELDGRNLTVNEARPREERPRTGGFRGGDRNERRSF